jgi:hypothetical protein
MRPVNLILLQLIIRILLGEEYEWDVTVVQWMYWRYHGPDDQGTAVLFAVLFPVLETRAVFATVTDTIAKFAKSHEKGLQYHINIGASKLLNVNNITRRLKRKKPFELVRP